MKCPNQCDPEEMDTLYDFFMADPYHEEPITYYHCEECDWTAQYRPTRSISGHSRYSGMEVIFLGIGKE